MDAIAAFAEHVVRTSYDDLPDDAVAGAKIGRASCRERV